MKIGILLSIAKTHLVSRKKQTIIAALGVTFGIGTYIIMMGFMNGLNDLLDGLILNRTPHIHLYNEVEPSESQPIDLHPSYRGKTAIVSSVKPKNVQLKIHNALPIISFLSRQKYIKGVTTQVKAQTFYVGGSSQLNGVLTGVDIKKEKEFYSIDNYIIEGNVNDLAQNEKGIIFKMRLINLHLFVM
jgi:lipoprotein-releasing system permease protein